MVTTQGISTRALVHLGSPYRPYGVPDEPFRLTAFRNDQVNGSTRVAVIDPRYENNVIKADDFSHAVSCLGNGNYYITVNSSGNNSELHFTVTDGNLTYRDSNNKSIDLNALLGDSGKLVVIGNKEGSDTKTNGNIVAYVTAL